MIDSGRPMSGPNDDQQLRKHELVRAHLLAEMRERLRPHEQLPTERDLSEELGVSRLTVRRALQQMSEEGRVYRVQGAGTFVAEPSIRKGDVLTSFSEDMRARGLTPSARLLEASETVAGAQLAWRLEVSPGEPLIHLVRLRLADDTPMCLERVDVVKRLAPDLLEQLSDASLYELLAERYRVVVTRADQSVTATVLDPEDAGHLEVPPLSPALLVERVTHDQQGRRVEFARSLYRGDRYAFEITLRRS
jgi:GntR family transcriptional regulator, N-acetylglucosamine utilization regulator